MVSIIGIITTRTITIIMIVIEINFPDHQCGWLHFLVLSYLNKDHKQKKGEKEKYLALGLPLSFFLFHENSMGS